MQPCHQCTLRHDSVVRSLWRDGRITSLLVCADFQLQNKQLFPFQQQLVATGSNTVYICRSTLLHTVILGGPSTRPYQPLALQLGWEATKYMFRAAAPRTLHRRQCMCCCCWRLNVWTSLMLAQQSNWFGIRKRVFGLVLR